jgi:hypothetical protein
MKSVADPEKLPEERPGDIVPYLLVGTAHTGGNI